MPNESQRSASWVLLQAQLPGEPLTPAGILLLDSANDQLHIALVEAVSSDEQISDIWHSLRQELAEQASGMGGSRLLESLESNLSWFLQIGGERQYFLITDAEQALAALFQNYVLIDVSLDAMTKLQSPVDLA